MPFYSSVYHFSPNLIETPHKSSVLKIKSIFNHYILEKKTSLLYTEQELKIMRFKLPFIRSNDYENFQIFRFLGYRPLLKTGGSKFFEVVKPLILQGFTILGVPGITYFLWVLPDQERACSQSGCPPFSRI